MLQIIHKLRDKYAYWLLLLFVPLEVLPFLFEPDSLMGKALLLIKTVLFGLLYILYADKQKWYIHLMLLITCVSMGVSVIKHGGVGTALLILTMFFALIAFPQIEITDNRLRCLYLLLAISGVGVAIYGMISNYINGISAFSWRGIFNPNTFGMILLSVFFYSLSSMHLKIEKNLYGYDCLLLILLLFLIYKTGCRSALLSMIAFVFIYVISFKTQFGRATYYMIAAFSILFCLAIAILEFRLNISEVANGFELFGKKIFSGRERIWSVVWKGFIETPLWGKSSEYLSEHTNLSSAHSVFMGVLIASGAIPCLLYMKLLFLPKSWFENIDNNRSTQLNKVCYTATVFLATFECIYTDSRLSLLFLPLLLCNKTNNAEHVMNNEYDSICYFKGFCKAKQSRIKGINSANSIISLFITICLCVTTIIEPIAISNSYEQLPRKMDAEYLENIGYEKTTGNLLQGNSSQSANIAGVIWDWNGESFDVIGTANGITSNMHFFSSDNSLPKWAEPGGRYRIIYESDIVRFRIYYCTVDGGMGRIVDTTTSTDFTIPEQAVGLIIRLTVEEGITARETVMPIILNNKD